MSDLNSVLIIGRLTRDAELKYLNSGTPVCNFAVAVNRSIPPKDGGEWKNEASFFDVQVWGKVAESKYPHLKQGKQVGIAGTLRQDRWEKDGQNHSRVYVVAEAIQLLSDPRGKQDAPAAPTGAKPASATPAQPGADFPDDIPF